jgi:hypothetical protein
MRLGGARTGPDSCSDLTRESAVAVGDGIGAMLEVFTIENQCGTLGISYNGNFGH